MKVQSSVQYDYYWNHKIHLERVRDHQEAVHEKNRLQLLHEQENKRLIVRELEKGRYVDLYC